MIPLLRNSAGFGNKTAIISPTGTYSYAQLHEQASKMAGAIAALNTGREPVLYLIPSGYEYVCVQWAIWLSGNIAVPVHTEHPIAELVHLLEDTGAKLFITVKEYAGAAIQSCKSDVRVMLYEELYAMPGKNELPDIALADDALMIYTSGTTGKPKGVVMSHLQIDTQLRSLSAAWEWSPSDHILNVLPMHHVHGIINITCCALYNGAILELLPRFDAATTAARMASGMLSLFMAVPTIYHKLASYYHNLSAQEQLHWQKGMRTMRLMVSGSAALPIPVLEEWQKISGHVLLERYGMTEIGMALANPLQGVRKPGYVGKPLPGVAVKITDEDGNEVDAPRQPGELYVKGPTVFQYYWRRPEETKRSFDGEWFKTGDIVERDEEGNYRILGRSATDIIKSGGYKISALEIEQVLLGHPLVDECAVVALPDPEWGERIAAAVAGTASGTALKEWLREKLAPYKIPRTWLAIDYLPRNAMGKVVKTELRQKFLDQAES